VGRVEKQVVDGLCFLLFWLTPRRDKVPPVALSLAESAVSLSPPYRRRNGMLFTCLRHAMVRFVAARTGGTSDVKADARGLPST
jgi:hypothetical protein